MWSVECAVETAQCTVCSLRATSSSLQCHPSESGLDSQGQPVKSWPWLASHSGYSSPIHPQAGGGCHSRPQYLLLPLLHADGGAAACVTAGQQARPAASGSAVWCQSQAGQAAGCQLPEGRRPASEPCYSSYCHSGTSRTTAPAALRLTLALAFPLCLSNRLNDMI